MTARETLEITITNCKSSVTPWDEKQWEAQVQFPGHTNSVKTYIKRQISDELIKDGMYQAEAIKNPKGYYELESIVPIGEYVANVDGNPAKPIVTNTLNTSGISLNSYLIMKQNASRSANILLSNLINDKKVTITDNEGIEKLIRRFSDVNFEKIVEKVKDGTWQEEITTKPVEDVTKAD